MNKKVLLASALLIGSGIAMAQQPKTTVEITSNGDTITTTTRSFTSYNADSLTYYFTNAVNQFVGLVDSAKYISRQQVYTVTDSNGRGVRRESYFSNSLYPIFTVTPHFYWGFHNWGDQMMNGLTGMSGANGIRTSFSNYQIELMTNINFNAHWQLGVGVAYESDCYKFKNDYVDIATNSDGTGSFFSASNGDISSSEGVSDNLIEHGYWDTRLVARYIDIPIRLGFTTSRGNVEIGLSVIPGFNYNGKHTGLKHRLQDDNYDHQSTNNSVEDYLNPFKCDLRLDIKKGCLGLFVQVPTMPVNTDMDVKLYPFKIGFVI